MHLERSLGFVSLSVLYFTYWCITQHKYWKSSTSSVRWNAYQNQVLLPGDGVLCDALRPDCSWYPQLSWHGLPMACDSTHWVGHALPACIANAVIAAYGRACAANAMIVAYGRCAFDVETIQLFKFFMSFGPCLGVFAAHSTRKYFTTHNPVQEGIQLHDFTEK